MHEDAPRLRRRSRKARLSCAAVLALAYLASSFGWRYEYSRTSAQRRTVWLFCPLTRQHGVIEVLTVRESTELSRALAAVSPSSGVTQSQWVVTRGLRLVHDGVLRVLTFGPSSHGRYPIQEQCLTDPLVARRIAWLVKYDAELALAMTDSLLFPHRDGHAAQRRRFLFETTDIWLCRPDPAPPEALTACRSLYGLPPAPSAAPAH